MVFSNGLEQSKLVAEGFSSVRGAVFATVVFSFFINLLMLVAPLYMLQVYDRVLTSQNKTTLLMLTVIAAGMLLVFAGMDILRSRVLVRVGYRLDRLLNEPVFSAVFARSVTTPGAGNGEALRDLGSLRDFIMGTGPVALCDAPWVPFFIAIVVLFHPILGAIALAGAAFIFLLALANELSTRRPLRASNQENMAANRFVATSVRNAEAVSAMGMLAGIRGRWGAHHQDALRAQSRASDRSGLILGSSRATRLLLQVAMLGAGALLVLRQEITPGTMIAASIIMGRALAPVEAAVGQWRGFTAARAAHRRLNQLLAGAESAPERMSLPSPRGRLAVEQAVVAPPGSSVPVLKGVNFRLEPGESLGIVGPSGAGKTTLARALMGVWPMMAGSIRLDGAEIADWDKAELGPHLGYLPQDVELFDGSVAENIARFGPVDADAVVRAAGMAGVHDMVLRLADGYDTRIGPDGHTLSAGQRQRIGLARALYGDVRFVLLDEPNSNLDSEGEKALAEAVTALKQAGATVVVITHRLPILSNVDHMLVLEDGRVKAFDTRQAIMARLTRPSVVAGQRGGPPPAANAGAQAAKAGGQPSQASAT